MSNILILDIETAPNIAYVWGCWKQNIGINMLKENGYIMSFAAKWLGNKSVIYEENRSNNDKRLVKKLIKLLDSADIVIAHNAVKFDLPTILGRAIVHNINPPSPYKVIDTLQVARREFRFVSNSLDYLTKVLGLDEKQDHSKFSGFKLWLECLKHNDEAWSTMKEYNINDTLILEQVYLRMRPWIKNHPNIALLYENEERTCTKCGSTNVHYRGYYTTNVGKYRRIRCNSCGGWSRTRYTILDKKIKSNLLTNAI